VAPQLDASAHMDFLGRVSPSESGAGVYLENGNALGVITVAEVSISTDDGIRGTAGGGRIGALMLAAQKKLGTPLYLVTKNWKLVTATGRMVR